MKSKHHWQQRIYFKRAQRCRSSRFCWRILSLSSLKQWHYIQISPCNDWLMFNKLLLQWHCSMILWIYSN
jgi:hypothetical protein